MLTLSKDQENILRKLLSWYTSCDKNDYITVGGYAGTGKTTTISLFRKLLYEKVSKKIKVAFCTYTGKASLVLKNKLKESEAIYKGDTVGTIHSLIYSPIEDKKGVIIGWSLKEEIKADLIVVDEASMVDRKIWNDLKRYNIPIIAVGDHGQLPPINGNFNLMNNPQLKLENIHRQNIGNPIIDMSIHARKTGAIPIKSYSNLVMKLDNKEYDTQDMIENLLTNYDKDTIVLCGYNITRLKINSFIRHALGFETQQPEVGDRLICGTVHFW